MTNGQVLSIGLSVLAVIVIPVLALLMRMVVKWTRMEAKLSSLIDDVKSIAQDKDKVHLEITAQMREDRRATDTRLRWLEENQWRQH